MCRSRPAYRRDFRHPFKAALLVVLGMALGCGVRGVPLAPLVIVPDAVTSFEAKRLDDEVHVRLEVPEENTDGTSPADLVEVEVYAVTTQPDPTRPAGFVLEEWLERASMIASIPLNDPREESVDDVAATVSNAGVAQLSTAEQGQEVSFIEVLTPEIMVPVPSEVVGTGDQPDSPQMPMAGPLVSPPLPVPPRRTYLAVAVSTRGRKSAASRRVDVTLGNPTSAPDAPIVTYTESEFLLEWSAPALARLPIQDPVTDGAIPSRPIVERGPPTAYSVYVVEVDPAERAPERRVPLNESPITGTFYVDAGLAFGEARCYVLRARDVIDSLEVEGPGSEPTCVVPKDTFAPRAPVGLVAVASADAISLVWDLGPEADISGYLVLRGTAPGETLDGLTPEPIAETTYRDPSVESDQLYVYVVQAVDNATPPNLSPFSVEVMERAR